MLSRIPVLIVHHHAMHSEHDIILAIHPSVLIGGVEYTGVGKINNF